MAKKKITPSRKTTAASTKRVAKKVSTSSSNVRKARPAETMPFTRKNYILILIGIAILSVGYLLMSVGEFQDVADGFSVALHVAPIVVIAGFVEIVYAIMYREKSAD